MDGKHPDRGCAKRYHGPRCSLKVVSLTSQHAMSVSILAYNVEMSVVHQVMFSNVHLYCKHVDINDYLKTNKQTSS